MPQNPEGADVTHGLFQVCELWVTHMLMHICSETLAYISESPSPKTEGVKLRGRSLRQEESEEGKSQINEAFFLYLQL
jgi:hypothetical protein